MTRHARIAYLDGPRLRRSLMAACEHAQRQRGELNRINVFPVPDGDTGTNLALTVRAISDHLRPNRDRDVASVAREAARAAVLGARGNSGMMLSHFLLGFAEHLEDRSRITVEDFREALKRGVEHLHQALEKPVEGTILTVMRETAEAADELTTPDFVPLVQHLVARARESLERTPDLLPVLRRAGVVDAGAKGFVSLLEGVLLFIHGDPLVAVPDEEGAPGAARAAAADVTFPEPSERYRFCTEGLVEGEGLPAQEDVRSRLRALGDSLIVIRSGDMLKVHVHTDEPETVFTYLRGVGDLLAHKAEDMEAQHETVGRAADAHVHLARRPVVVVTDSAADLPEAVVRAHGIHVTPLLLLHGDETLRDGVDITAEEFHRRLEEPSGDLPTTSQPAPADFLETFERAAGDGEHLVAVLLASALSGTFQSAEAAAGRLHGASIRLVDSRGASLLQGLLALEACELAEAGLGPDAIVERLEAVRDRSGILFTVDRFDRLLASGRVGRGRALLGTMLSVKPILAVGGDGRIEPVGRALGRRRVLPAMMAALAERVPTDAARIRFGIVHVGTPEVVRPVTLALRSRWGRDAEVLAGPATPVLSTHLGPGAWGLAWLVDEAPA